MDEERPIIIDIVIGKASRMPTFYREWGQK